MQGPNRTLPENNNTRHIIWLDILCWESFIKILRTKSRQKKEVHFCQVSCLISPFLKLLVNLFQIELNHINNFSAADKKINEESVYQLVQESVIDFLKKTISDWLKTSYFQRVLQKHNLNSDKVSMFLQQEVACFAYRPIELKIIAAASSNNSRTFFLLNSPLSKQIVEEFQNETVIFYKSYVSRFFLVNLRKGYLFDKKFSKKYKTLLFETAVKFAFRYLFTFVKVFIRSLHPQAFKKDTTSKSICIGVEQLQAEVRQNAVNDLFWVKESNINPAMIYHIESACLDEESSYNLDQLGVNRVFTPPVKAIFKIKTKGGPKWLLPDYKIFSWILSLNPQLFIPFFYSSETYLKKILIQKFLFLMQYWINIYSQLNMKILFSMADGGTEIPIKAQAVEKLGGGFVGGHWSNYPHPHIINQKGYDLMISWGPFFNTAFFRKGFLNKKVLFAGYPSNYCPLKLKESADKIKDIYKNKYIISFFDNIWANDIIFSKSMFIQLYNLFIDILQNRQNAILIVKPKKKEVWEEIQTDLPILKTMVEQGRIVPFWGDKNEKKVLPALVGMASDLAVGIGISTAACECYWAGTNALHADLTDIKGNLFKEQGLNEIIFTRLDNLKKKIYHHIDGEKKEWDTQVNVLYKQLDPFQDGKAYKRYGYILKTLYDSLHDEFDFEHALLNTEIKYNIYLKQHAVLNSIP